MKQLIILHLIILLIVIKCGEDPALKINLNPPEENPKDTIGRL